MCRVTQGNMELNNTLNSYKDYKTAQSKAAQYLYNWLYARFNYLNTQWGDSKDVLTGL